MNRTGTQRREDGCCVYCLKPLESVTNKFCNQSCITAWVNKRRAVDISQRFLAGITKTDTCWLWAGAPRGFGYGRLQQGKKVFSTHRYSWEFHNGPIPTGLSVLHKCDNPICVNPEHLFLGTQYDNMQDRKQKGKYSTGVKWQTEHGTLAQSSAT